MSSPIRIALLASGLALAACSDDGDKATGPDNPPNPPPIACETRPGELPRPPEGVLPCELLPPGFEP